MILRVRITVLVTALAALTASRAHSQCPDGSPPPCRTASAARGTPAPPALSIAVLPFESRSPDSADAYLADGMTEEVANRLTRVARLQVKARGLVGVQWRRTPEPFAAARGLGVAWFVHGNVRRVGSQLLVNVELVRATTGEEAWASRFPRRDADVFAVQAEIAESVAVQVSGRLTPGERAVITRRPTQNNEAYRLFLYGNVMTARRTPEDLAAAVRAYEEAIRLDSGFANAWARLSTARSIQLSWGWPTGMSDDSMRALSLLTARRAVALDSLSSDAWAALGEAETDLGELYRARLSFERAVRLDSSSADAWHHYATNLYSSDCPYACLALPAAAIPLLRRALALDPTLRNTWRHLAAVETDANELTLAEAHLDTALSFGPWPPANGDRSWLRYLRGDLAGAAADDSAGAGAPQRRPYLRAYLRAAHGDSSAVRAMLDSARAQRRPLERAYAAMVLGLRAEVLSALEEIRPKVDSPPVRCTPSAVCSPNVGLWRLLHDPLFRPLRGEARFERLWNDTRPSVPWLAGSGTR